ncbi:MAG: transposase, partial [Clostridiales bacterium]|nr:transposase [Clostridiales bacterium]
MNYSQVADLYTDYLICSFSLASATNMSRMLDNNVSHDKITRLLSDKELTSKDYWLNIKPIIRQMESDDGVIIVDDTIEEKPFTDENDIVCYHYDHTKGISIKGINIVNFLYHSQSSCPDDFSLPLAFQIISKTEKFFDEKTQKQKRKSTITKNEILRNQLKVLIKYNHIKAKYILFDIWYSSKENMEHIKVGLKKDFVCAIKDNRTVALSFEDKLQGKFNKISDLGIKAGQTYMVYLKGLEFPVILAKQVFTNKDGSTGELYLVSSDIQLNYSQLITIYKRRWKVEPFHKSLKQNAALDKSPTKTQRTQSNHVFYSMMAFIKLEQLKVKQNLNHFALKSQIYVNALKACFIQLTAIKEKHA